MFHCKNCDKYFNKPQKIIEQHGFSNPPYEKSYVCPFCNSTDYLKVEQKHCKCCGALIIKSQSEYCSTGCKTKGEKLWKEQIEKFKIEYESPLNVIIREMKEYNSKNGRNLSYGEYVSLKYLQRRTKKCSKKKSNI